MQEDGIKGLTDVADGIEVANLPAMLPVLMSITGVASSPPSQAAGETGF